METADTPCWALEVQGTGTLFASGDRNLRDAGFGLRTIVQRMCHGAVGGDGTEMRPSWDRAETGVGAGAARLLVIIWPSYAWS